MFKKNVLKFILAIIAGIFISICVLELFESINSILYKPAQNNTLNSKDAFNNYIKNLPTNAFILLIVSYALSSFIGGYVAGRISKWQTIYAGIFVGLFLLIASIFNFSTMPHPMWVIVCSCICFMPFSFLGSYLAKNLQQK